MEWKPVFISGLSICVLPSISWPYGIRVIGCERFVEIERCARHAERIEDELPHSLVIGIAERNVRILGVARDVTGSRRHRIAVLKQLAVLLVGSVLASIVKVSCGPVCGVVPRIQSKSLRGTPVQAHTKSSMRTFAVVAGLPRRNDGYALTTGSLHWSFPWSTTRASMSVVRPLVFEAIMKRVFLSTGVGLPNVRTPRPPSYTTLP